MLYILCFTETIRAKLFCSVIYKYNAICALTILK